MPTALITLILALVDGKLAVQLGRRLDNSAFNAYRDVSRAAGFGFDRALKTNVGSLGDAARFAKEADGRFDVQVTQEAHDAIADYIASNDAAGHVDGLVEDLAARGFKLRDYQIEGVEYLAGRTRAFLFDDMGLGKTAQTLCALPRNAAALIVVPAQVKNNWAKECGMWRPDLTPVVLNGRNSLRWPEPGEVLITNWAILSDIGPAPAGVIVAADEAHKAKNAKAKRTVLFRKVSKAARANGGKCWQLTGTPMLNRPGELWNVLQNNDMAREAFGSFDNFLRVFNGRRGFYGIEWGPLGDADVEGDFGELLVKSRTEAVKLLASVAFGREKADVAAELPNKVFNEVQVEVSKKALKAMDAFVALAEKHGYVFVDGKILDKDSSEVTLDDLAGSKISFEAVSQMRAAVAAAKVPALLKMVEEYEDNDEPLVVFSAHRAPIEELAKREGWVSITGDHTADQKFAAVEGFQNGDYKGIACTNAAIEGITLTRAAHMLFVDRFWTPGQNRQAQDRIHRIGQDRTCFYTDLVADHVLDAAVMDLLRVKEGHLETISAAAKESAPETPLSELSAWLKTATIHTPAMEAPASRRAQRPAQAALYAETLALFKKAKDKGAKYPKFFLSTPAGDSFELAHINSGSNVGGVNVSSGGFGSDWYGRINANGAAHASYTDRCPADVDAAILAFQSDPASFAKAHGKRTSRCCFCAREFDRLVSAEHGYGPDCADKYGLPFDHARYGKGEQLPHEPVSP